MASVVMAAFDWDFPVLGYGRGQLSFKECFGQGGKTFLRRDFVPQLPVIGGNWNGCQVVN